MHGIVTKLLQSRRRTTGESPICSVTTQVSEVPGVPTVNDRRHPVAAALMEVHQQESEA